ncbi:MAG: hypothetical protein MJ094_06980 [Saccharofermentans sp.]|nr:hypothetical protein [Saccharofermentans sp.]
MKNKILHAFLVYKEQFCKLLTFDYHEDELQKYCIAKSPTLEKGILYICPISAYISKLNKRFEFEFPSGEGIDIYSNDITAESICEFVNSPIKLCKNCCPHEMSVYKWQCNYKSYVKGEDWIISKEDKTVIDFNSKRLKAYAKEYKRERLIYRLKKMLSI